MALRKKPNIDELKKKAIQLRKDVLKMIETAGSGHPGGSLSVIDILVGLYYHKLKYKSENPKWSDRDICILSKGHACPAFYAVLADCGFFPKEELSTLRKLGSRLQGHAFFKVPGVEVSTGSLGQGLSLSNGFALAARLDGKKKKIYCILGDGEIQEGQVWEAAMFSAHHSLDNLVAIIDRNNLQIDGPVKETMDIEPLADKWKAFGWHVLQMNGHDIADILKTYDDADKLKGKPVVIIAHTTKGKGVSFMENQVGWHGISLTKKDLEQALKELNQLGG